MRTLPGKIGSRYEVRELIGRGGFGTVWRADGPDGPVAIKALHEEFTHDPEVVNRFVRERTVLLRLRHPNLVSVRDLVVEGELLALVMELVDGPSLRATLRARGSLPASEAGAVVAQVAEALAEAHRQGVVHRDIKPENVLLQEAGGTPRAMLADFGISRLLEGTRLTRTQTFLGTPDYLAPEVLQGHQAEPAADLYACGILLYELVSGATPFASDHHLAVLHRHVVEEPRRPAGIGDPLWGVINACLAKDPAKRPTAASLAQRLHDMLDDLPTVALTSAPAVTSAPDTARVTHVPRLTRALGQVPGQVPQRRRWTPGRIAALAAGVVVGCGVAAAAGLVGYEAGVAEATQPPEAAPQPGPWYLSELAHVQVANGYGPVALNASVGGADPDDGDAITLGGQRYERGLGVHAPSQLRFYPAGHCTVFEATVGIDATAAGQPGGTVSFQVYADSALVYDSGPVSHDTGPVPVSAGLTGAQVVELVVTDAGDGADYDHADWADARMTCLP